MKKTKKTGKTIRKASKKSKKHGFSEALRAFFLVGSIVAAATLVSFLVIFIHTSNNNRNMNNTVSHYIDEPYNEIDTYNAQEQQVQPALPPAANINPIMNTNPAVNTNQDANTVKPPSVNTTVNVKPETTVKEEVKPASKPAQDASNIVSRGTLVFVIDDAGNNLRELEPFLNIQGSLTIAVLPGLPYSAEAARRIRAAGKEVILHQPMEAIGAQNPGPGAIYSGMNADEITAVLSRNVVEVGPVAGINNHQGSKITMDIEAMETILKFCAENNLYFLDSRTTADTAAPAAAQKIGMKIAERNIFIDNEQNRESMLGYISSALTRAQNYGSAVMIGHTWSVDLAPLLMQQFPLLLEQGYTIRTVSDILK